MATLKTLQKQQQHMTLLGANGTQASKQPNHVKVLALQKSGVEAQRLRANATMQRLSKLLAISSV